MIALILVSLMAGVLLLLIGVSCEEKKRITGKLFISAVFTGVILVVINLFSFSVGEKSSGVIKLLYVSSVYEVLATTPTPDGEVLVQINNLDTLTDDDKRKKIGIFPTFPPEGHILGTAKKRTFLIPSGSTLTETADGRIVLVTSSGTGQVITDTKKVAGE